MTKGEKVVVKLTREHADALLPTGPIDPTNPCRLCDSISPAHFCEPQLEAELALDQALRTALKEAGTDE